MIALLIRLLCMFMFIDSEDYSTGALYACPHLCLWLFSPSSHGLMRCLSFWRFGDN